MIDSLKNLHEPVEFRLLVIMAFSPLRLRDAFAIIVSAAAVGVVVVGGGVSSWFCPGIWRGILLDRADVYGCGRPCSCGMSRGILVSRRCISPAVVGAVLRFIGVCIGVGRVFDASGCDSSSRYNQSLISSEVDMRNDHACAH